MVGLFARLIEHRVGFYHVIDNIALGDLLGAELLWRRQIHAIIVSEMVVTDDRNWF